jgi:Ser/Thr protein kinase RdoA (MazF antagonist)
VRLFTFVSGEPIEGREPSPALYRDIGRNLAALDKALGEFRNPPAEHLLLWNVHRAANLLPFICHVNPPDRRKMVERVFKRLEGHALKNLGALRSQVIHNDFNPKNVLVESSSPNRVSGIIDFGDLVESALIIDLGVAISRQVHLTDTLVSACEIVRGYHTTLPLEDREVVTLFDVICARLAIRAVIWSWRGSLQDPRFHIGRIGDTFDVLAVWLGYGETQVTDACFAACGPPLRKRSRPT